MKTTLATSDIAHALKSDENAAWSWTGAKALAEYLEEYEESTGEELELDVCSIRCDFSESPSLQDWLMEHHGAETLSFALQRSGLVINDIEDEEGTDEAIRSYIQDHGHLIEFGGGVIVSSF